MTEERPIDPPTAHEVLNAWDFYRCYECKRLITHPEVQRALATNGQVCTCGKARVSPTNLPWWGWALPKVWWFAVQRLRGLA